MTSSPRPAGSFLGYVEDYAPSIVAIEKPLLFPTKRAALVSVIVQELHARSREVGMKVVEIAPREVRRIVVGNPHAKKLEVAQTIVRMGFPDLAVKLPKEPPHPVLGYKPKDKYWLHMFDALAVALAADGYISRATSSAPASGASGSAKSASGIAEM